MKILLVQPPAWVVGTPVPPLGLAYLASCSEKIGNKVKIIDSVIMDYNFEDIEKEIKNFDPNLIGATSPTQHIYNALKIVKIAKENNPNCVTVLGGPHPTVTAKETLQENKFVDVIVRGEGEATFVDLLENISNLHRVKGISYREKDKIIENMAREYISDLDSLAFPAYHLLPMEKYKIKYVRFDLGRVGSIGDQYCAISTCRGCPYNCSFCSSRALWGKKWRARSAENVIDEIKFLKDKYNVKIIDFMDDTFTINKERVLKISELTKKEGIDISWTACTRVNLFDKDIAKSFKKGGCRLINFGLESANQQTLDFLQKGFTIDDSLKAVKNAKEENLNVAANFIIGVPGENRKMINKTILFAKKLNLKAPTFSILNPLPGTKIYENAKQNNLLLTKDWSSYTPFESVLNLKNISPVELKRLQLKSYLVCYYLDYKKVFFIMKRDFFGKT